MVSIGSIEFTGGGRAWVPVEEYRAARPDPLWRVAPGILHHLEHGHMGELIHCVRAHGMTRANWVIPRGLDRYGLELLVFTTDGIAAVRLSFPDGPVSSLDDVPVSLRTAMTCRCEAGSRHGRSPRGGASLRQPVWPTQVPQTKGRGYRRIACASTGSRGWLLDS